MIKHSTKLKRGTQLLYNGSLITIERDREDGTALIRIGDEPLFEDVDVCDLKPIHKQRSVISNKPKVLTSDEKAFKEDLNDFYIKMSLTMPYNCMECGKPLYAFTKPLKRCVTAHIFPKAEFGSIATDPDNIFFLGWAIIGVCTHHDDWDRKGAKNRTKMKVYDLALEKFNEILKHKMTNHEIKRAYTYLNLEWQ